MKRRDFLISIICSGLAWPCIGYAQQPRKPHRVAVLMTTQRDRVWRLSVALMDALHTLGYVEGENVLFDHRFAEGNMEKLDGLAAEFVFYVS